MTAQRRTPPRYRRRRPVDAVVAPLDRFLHVEYASGLLLLIAAAGALAVANSPWGAAYLQFWKTDVGIQVGSFSFTHSLKHWVNDGLMAIFFFVVGLEIKRELVAGELSSVRKAILPLAGALGGMVAPAAIYLLLQGHGPAARGWGIPMATDIAFVVGCMALLGSRIPRGLQVFVLSLAIIDDLGAVLVIAVGYTADLRLGYLVGGAAALSVVVLFERLGVRSYAVYIGLGALVWFCFHESGVHATVAGVLLGLLTPARPYLEQTTLGQALQELGAFFHGREERPTAADVNELRSLGREAVSPLEQLENTLHPWVSFAIMPIFALANAGVPFQLADLTNSVAIAVGIGLLGGKPLGILAFAWLAVRLGWAELPSRVDWSLLTGAGILAGIGFTMALFIANLALEGDLLTAAKIGILGASACAAVSGLLVLFAAARRTETPR
ncbi:MAG: Na+/H+ antiporter NhaA [Acidobacteriota bacterium]